MGLQEHEFDVAPELLAALSRGTSGPLLDAALVHGANVAEAAADLRAAEQSERLRDAADSVKGALSAALHGAEAAVRDVGDRGAFDSGRVGGAASGPSRIGESSREPGRLGPGRTVGQIAIGRHGSIPGVTAQQFSTASRLGRVAWSSLTRASLQIPQPETDRQHELWNMYLEAEYMAGTAMTPEESEYWRGKTENRFDDYIRERGLKVRVTPKPDGDEQSILPSTGVQWESLLRFLLSYGGLGVRERSQSGRGARRVRILDAVDPSPNSDESDDGISAEIRAWQLWLVDPTPEV